MTESSWGSEGEAPRTRRVPAWVWFCGLGCLVALVLALVAVGYVYRQIKDANDPAKATAALAEVLPHDPLPPEMRFEFRLPLLVLDWYVFADDRGYAWIVYVAGAGQAAEMRKVLLDPEFTGAVFGQGGRKDPVEAQVRVQGRDLRGVRFVQEAGDEQRNAGPSIVVEVTPEGAPGFVAVHLIRITGDEPISDDDVRELLEPFHVGPER